MLTTRQIDCFQGLITDGPPVGCKEATNYLCFCTMPTLQSNFVQCADKTCVDEKAGAMAWANELCSSKYSDSLMETMLMMLRTWKAY